MSHDAETELWKLAGELQQLEGATHYYSDLPPTAKNYKDQWQYFASRSDDLTAIFGRLSTHLKAIGIEKTPPDDVNAPANNDEIPF